MIENEDYMKMALANLIKEQIKEEFRTYHLSGNLADTVTIEFDNQNVKINIPAQLYDISLFKKQGIVVYDREGSYAQVVNEHGGFSKRHINFLTRAVQKALEIFNADFNFEKEKEYFL